jgi:hypothetical protein
VDLRYGAAYAPARSQFAPVQDDFSVTAERFHEQDPDDRYWARNRHATMSDLMPGPGADTGIILSGLLDGLTGPGRPDDV